MVHEYWVALRHGEVELGAGFLLTGRFLVTAEHCLRNLPTAVRDVGVVFADRTVRSAQVQTRLPDADLALIMLGERSPVRSPVVDTCSVFDPWRVPSRPKPTDPQLSGEIVASATQFTCEGGAELTALQLRTDTVLGDYSGYSGGPVERSTRGEQRLVGVLLEQYPDRQYPERASNVLFAATVSEVINRFDQLHNANLINAFRDPSTTNELINLGKELMESSDQWQGDAMLTGDQMAGIKLHIARSVIDGAIRRKLP
ncbi:trypsin-like peptidase domain-containing protein [Umezawaea sp. Da 62-37]|uniref:S1 family peptidase n=1 Tax=Umezawaea sp. Da 62-37 TaxID=3075927 RepID=UPI0028F70A2A|nr:trypsin-like peptidase domain-containing protein [Umezawaea sp. Da 62-37]WNV90775.1 trypsin-like peptidase domain-containing protein [Umezawaea sp. Da 62-37]